MKQGVSIETYDGWAGSSTIYLIYWTAAGLAVISYTAISLPMVEHADETYFSSWI